MQDNTALDICAGAGGLSLGFQRAGWTVQGLEFDEAAADTHRRHVGPCEIADVRTYHPSRSYRAAVGGVPCQPFSAAGQGLALDDPRYLVPDFLRIAREASAEVVMLENVRGLVTRHPRAFRVVLDAFEAEYLTTWTILNAAHYGVPQSRERLFVVGFKSPDARARFRWPAPTHAPPGELFGQPHRTVREALELGRGAFRTGRKEGTAGWQGVRMLDVDAPGFTIGTKGNADLLDRPAPCVTATEQKSAMSGKQPMSRRRRASERLSEALGALDQPAPCISAGGTESGGGAEPIANMKARQELHEALEAAGLADRPATTVQGDPRIAVAGHHDRQQNGAVRLTPRQCALLQGFPGDWTWTGNKSQQHRAIGNAVPPALAEAMGRALSAALG